MFKLYTATRTILYVTIVIFAVSCTRHSLLKAEKLTVSEGFENPLGFYDSIPTFSWKLPVSDDIKTQTAYQIVVASDPQHLPNDPDLWDSGKQTNSRSTYIKYEGDSLRSRQKAYWQVRYWNQNDVESPWSEIHSLELGLLRHKDWQAKWIGLNTTKDSLKGTKGSIVHTPQYLRKPFNVPDGIKKARLYVTAQGVFNGYLNSTKISDDVMAPGWTPYAHRIETMTYDVTELIETGDNVISFELAPGWYVGRLGWGPQAHNNMDYPKLLCQLEMTLSDGSEKVILSDGNWKASTNGPLRFSEIYDGEIYDANFEILDWQKNHFDDTEWESVLTEAIADSVMLQPKRHHSVSEKLRIETQNLIIENNHAIFDLEQNMVGVALVTVPMRKGDTLKIRFSEMLQPDGSFYTDNYRSAKSTDYYIAADDGIIEWAPKFTFHGFRYVEVSGYDPSIEPKKDWVTGIVQHSNFDQVGTFESSHEKLNQLHDNIIWGLRGNFFDIPTDCPQRDERLGWTGDAQVFAPTSMFIADVHAFWASWLQSLREEQFENGGIPFVVPDVLHNGRVSSGWGDAAVIIPWEIYWLTGDRNVLVENYEMMKKWVEHHKMTSENFISNMNTYGDWLQPFPIDGPTNRNGDTADALIGTAYFAYTANLVAKTAQLLNYDEDASKYNNLFLNVSQAFQNHFFDEEARVKNGEETQTSYLLALGFDLLRANQNEKAFERLIKKINDADGHLRTGFLGTPLLPKVLDRYGKIELMGEILFKETYPSWFFSINQGATTIWERWNSYDKETGFNSQAMNSLNHYAYGAIGQWMHERLAGIAPLEPGYKSIRIAPQPIKPLNACKATYQSPYGKIMSGWKIENSYFELFTEIPPNTSATVTIPCSKKSELKINGHSINHESGVQLMAATDTYFELLVSPGRYHFKSEWNQK